ncbi:ABC transporter ATP-binding protein [Periweissella cryptocerci]|uniref:ABC-type quaternary amine transporter n=1 Tax=Periweissella cryptocerci TaxID=2506420 RepID=A0A4P6YU51_9LACO|nr:ABC transporter ATP-binding protein [Periweissella cryptocerci]QBO36309.1 ABC transporter ATP-binding protein [Periweissella cryptocerci]
MIEFKHVMKKFNNQVVIPDLNFTINDNEIFVLVGSSGSGKTTTMKMINRLLDADAGVIEFNGKDVQSYPAQALRWQMGYVMQSIGLFPHMTVAENIGVVPTMQKQDPKQIATQVDELLRRANLNPAQYRNRMPQELSGGEQQRIGILRALAMDGEVLLMDEPFSALDPLVRTQLQDFVLEIQAQVHKTIVFVTHDTDEALKMADRIGVMQNGELLQIAPPSELLAAPANDFVRAFFKLDQQVKVVAGSDGIHLSQAELAKLGINSGDFLTIVK